MENIMFVSNTCALLIRSDQRAGAIDIHYVMHVENLLDDHTSYGQLSYRV